MPDHFHLLITPSVTLERAIQLVKGGFSYEAKKALGSNLEIWRRGFADHRIRDAEDYDKHAHYIHLNPVKKLLCERPELYRYSSAFAGWKLDPIPQGLKPTERLVADGGTAEAVPFQNSGSGIALEGHDFSRAENGRRIYRALAHEGTQFKFPNTNGTGNHATQK
jgi:hypothetical protein